MTQSCLPDAEIKALDRLAQGTIIYLLLIGLAAFFAGSLSPPGAEIQRFIAIALIGTSGSAIAALTSCLDRYAIGFERENGQPFPEGAAKGAGKFNRRFARWLFVRPFLGAIIAPVFIWRLSHFTQDPGQFLGKPEGVGFTAFVGGLLAKSILDLIKNLFKNVFRA